MLRRPWPFVRRHRLAVACGALALVLLAGGLTAWLAYRRLDGNIGTDAATGRLLDLATDRPLSNGLAVNILLIGSDDRSGANEEYGSAGGQRSDTTILLHLSADRRYATAVSVPRDVMVGVPACDRPDGTRSRAAFTQFNQAFELGGPACTIRTLERLSGLRIDHHLILDFTGFKRMVDAVGGVEVCVAQPIHDRKAQLDLPAGRQVLHGEQALGYVRARESLGDGSDTQRMGRQQQFLASLIRKVQSQGVLLNPVRIWPLLDAATSAITADPGLSRLSALYDLTQQLRSMPPQNVTFLTAPRRPYRLNRNRDEFVQPQTDQLFAALREDRTVEVHAYAGVLPGASPAPGAGSATDDPDGPEAADGDEEAGAAEEVAPEEGAEGTGAGAAPATPSAAGSRPAASPASPWASPSASPTVSPSVSPSAGGSAGTAPSLPGSTADQDPCSMH
ncbi:LCP family protein [Kitasatospora camelliae]|uniref:LCP family protein n=1 Tax=Kitasatospora camelliae TaxID=3156397 RepID=A0AAU8JUB3_9ACTN